MVVIDYYTELGKNWLSFCKEGRDINNFISWGEGVKGEGRWKRCFKDLEEIRRDKIYSMWVCGRLILNFKRDSLFFRVGRDGGRRGEGSGYSDR